MNIDFLRHTKTFFHKLSFAKMKIINIDSFCCDKYKIRFLNKMGHSASIKLPYFNKRHLFLRDTLNNRFQHLNICFFLIKRWKLYCKAVYHCPIRFFAFEQAVRITKAIALQLVIDLKPTESLHSCLSERKLSE